MEPIILGLNIKQLILIFLLLFIFVGLINVGLIKQIKITNLNKSKNKFKKLKSFFKGRSIFLFISVIIGSFLFSVGVIWFIYAMIVSNDGLKQLVMIITISPTLIFIFIMILTEIKAFKKRKPTIIFPIIIILLLLTIWKDIIHDLILDSGPSIEFSLIVLGFALLKIFGFVEQKKINKKNK